jgi:NAD(P)-dependent dehydrogenase (short-subunit alcohol dehydrogenase family)
MSKPVAVVTGGSRGLGLALAGELAARGWSLVLDARGAEALEAAAEAVRERGSGGAPVVALAGDVADGWHQEELLSAARDLGGLDLLVNNASVLGSEPLRRLAELPLDGFRRALEVNVVAPLALVQRALPLLRERAGAVLDISSDAAVEAYPTWGGYGASKAALDRLSAVLAEEEPEVRVWSVDPGEMRTALYAAAVPDDDMSGCAAPEAVAEVLGVLVSSGPVVADGRYSVAELRRRFGAGQGVDR